MEIVDYDKTKHWEIMTIRDQPGGSIQGYILRFVCESGRETRICMTPEELQQHVNGCQEVLK